MVPGNSDPGQPDPAATAAAEWRALAPLLAARGVMRLSLDGGRSYPRRHTRSLTPDPPPCRAAVHLYGAGGTTRLLAADFDTKRAAHHGHGADPDRQVTDDAAAFAVLVGSCGGRAITDRSPTGGRHVYVLWAAPIPHTQMRPVALALARRYATLDPSPMLGCDSGIITVPGTRHGSRGFRALTMPLTAAQRCAAQPNGPAVWDRLCAALSGELEAVDRGEAPLPPPGPEAAPAGARWRRDGAGARWLPRPGGRAAQLRPDAEAIAVHGEFDPARRTTGGKPWTPSEARFSVLCSAAARGWQLGEVIDRMNTGAWSGLARFYHRYPPKWRTRALATDWDNAVTVAAGQKNGRTSNTRETNHTGGNHPRCDQPARSPVLTGHQEIRQIYNALRAAELRRWPGRHGITLRMVMRGILAACQLTGGTVIEFGARSLGMLAGVDHTTAARALRELRDEDDPFIELLDSPRFGPASKRSKAHADLYLVRVPHGYTDVAQWHRWRRGRIGIHPVFRAVGGGPAALIYEQLGTEPVRTTDLPDATGLSATAVSDALAQLGAHGLAVRGPDGWRRGPADLDELAASLGVLDELATLQAQHKKERELWRAWLMQIPPPPQPTAEPGEAWLDEPMSERWAGRPAATRAPPHDHDAIATLQAVLGLVRVVSAA